MGKNSAISWMGTIVIFLVGGTLLLLSIRGTAGSKEITEEQMIEPVKQQESELRVEVIQEGSGAIAEEGKRLHVYYTGRLVDGTVFDARTSGEPLSFVLGAREVISGWELGISGMKVGEIRTLEIPPDLAYGAAGIGPIPPNATLLFEVELVDVTE